MFQQLLPSELSGTVEELGRVVIIEQNLLVLLNDHDGPDLLPPEVSHHPAIHSVGNTGVIEQMDVVVETSFSSLSVGRRAVMLMVSISMPK